MSAPQTEVSLAAPHISKAGLSAAKNGSAAISPNLSDFMMNDDRGLDEPCVSVGTRTLTRAQVRAAAKVASEAFQQNGVRAGDIVAVHLPNSLDSVPALLGVWAIGAAVAPLNPRLGERDLSRSLAALRPRGVVTSKEQVERVAQDAPQSTIFSGGGWVAERAIQESCNQVPVGTALVMHTSGTTGPPKAVLLSHQAVTEALNSVLRHLRGREAPESDRPAPPNLIAFPLAHVAGLYNLLLALRNRRHIILLPRFTVESVVDAVHEYRMPSIVLNPTMIQMLLEADIPGDRLATLRFVRSGSAPLPAVLARRFMQRYGIPVLNGYGQTETAGEVIGWNARHFEQFGAAKLGSVGRPHPRVEIKFVDEELRPVSKAEIGELCVRSRFVMDGFLADVAEGKFTEDGFLRTGDLGYTDDDGFVWLAGRRSDVIVCGGFKVMPEEVEDVLHGHPGVADVMVAGVADERLGEAPHAFVVARPGSDLSTEDVVGHVREHLSHYKAPRRVHFVGGLPRNEAGKLLRKQADQLVAELAGRNTAVGT